MADKKFGQKRVCSNCETKFYDLNKNSPLTCPHCTSEIVIENELSNYSTSQVVEEQKKIIKTNLMELKIQITQMMMM